MNEPTIEERIRALEELQKALLQWQKDPADEASRTRVNRSLAAAKSAAKAAAVFQYVLLPRGHGTPLQIDPFERVFKDVKGHVMSREVLDIVDRALGVFEFRRKEGAPAAAAATTAAKAEPARDASRVFVVYGRNAKAYEATVAFLRSLGLRAWDFYELAAKCGGAAFVGDIVRRGMQEAQAVIVLFTPDEYSSLSPALRKPHDTAKEIQRWQSRPNVVFEAGLAMGMDEGRTILVTLGSDVSLFSDVDGRHLVRLDNSPRARDYLRRKLIGVGCRVQDSSDWHDPATAGDFEAPVHRAPAAPRDPFGDPVPETAAQARKPKVEWTSAVQKNGRRLLAIVRATSDPEWFDIRLEVRSMTAKPLTGSVRFRLDDDFADPSPEVRVDRRGVAMWEGQAWGAFRVAAACDRGKTRLSLDLARIPGIPASFAA